MRSPTRPFKCDRTEQARAIIARGLAQRVPADVTIRELVDAGLLAEGMSTEVDHDRWRS